MCMLHSNSTLHLDARKYAAAPVSAWLLQLHCLHGTIEGCDLLRAMHTKTSISLLPAINALQAYKHKAGRLMSKLARRSQELAALQAEAERLGQILSSGGATGGAIAAKLTWELGQELQAEERRSVGLRTTLARAH